jgi:EAL domain-containing protein (putative c-di-GMP-specific phosphodiesterase class I)
MERANFVRCESLDLVQTALKEGRLFPGYQPIVDLTTGKTIGLEALMRINARSGKMVTAGELLPALADPIVSREIGVSMMNQVAKEFSGLQKALPDLRFVSINAAESDLLSQGFVDSLFLSMEANRIDFTQITLEVTETMLLAENAQDLGAVLQDLKRCGVNIALDDFGTGYSSFTHLQQFPIDKVKIDRSFVQAMENKGSASMIVQSLIKMARDLGLDVIAEGIETESQKASLSDMGCKLGQGFLFGAAKDLCSISSKQLKKAC